MVSRTVETEHAGLRLDVWLGLQPEIGSRTKAQYLIERGQVFVDARIVKASHKLQVQQIVQFAVAPPLSETTEPGLIPLQVKLDVRYEDEHVLVLNKAAGVVVHPSCGHAQDTLVNMLLAHTDQLSMRFGEKRPGIVHRLDRDTSGLLVVAKSDLAHLHLSQQFKDKTVHRLYWTIVPHRAGPASGTVTTRLLRDPRNRKRFASTKNDQGKLAITHFRRITTSSKGADWLECRLETGRTHQIRVHMFESSRGILGDPIYVTRTKLHALAPRLALHACALGFEHPTTGQFMTFQAGWPDDLRPLIDLLGFKESS
jgi:23S rRNA pseudouridine1911/1915/1917 synthase